jgi:GNAT superfamily N-acetyltransferase
MITYDAPTLADAEALDAMAVQSWDETFAHFYRPSDLAAFKAQAFGPDGWLRRDLSNPDVRWHVARADGAIIGFIKLMPPYIEGAGPDDTMIGQLYILSAWHGRGVAQALMQWAIDTARAVGSPAVLLTVFEENHRAIAFYAKYGFVHIGDYGFPVGEQIDRDLILRLEL